MRRLSMVLAAAVSSAMIVVAVVAIDSVGAHENARVDPDLAAKFADCVRDRGESLRALRACKAEVAPVIKEGTATADARKLATCLREQGLEVPTDPLGLKRWIASQRGRAVEQALQACGVGPAPCGAKDAVAAGRADAAKLAAEDE